MEENQNQEPIEGTGQPSQDKVRFLRIPKLKWGPYKKTEAKISPETEKELKEIFEIFATNDFHNKVNPNDLKEGLVTVGFNRECPEIFRVIEDLCFEYDKDKELLNFMDFINYLNVRLGDISTRNGSNRIFEKLMDPDVKQITPSKLHEIIEYCDHQLSKEDVEYMLRTIFNQGDEIDINQDEFYYIMTKRPSDIDNITSVTKSK